MMMLKHFVHYESVTRVPLAIHIPGKNPARHAQALVSTADLAPTMLGLANVRPFHGIQGKNLQPILAGEHETIRDAVLIEEDQPFSVQGLPAPVRMRSVITARGRLTQYFGSGIVELYDHGNDPDELHNLAAAPAAAELQRELEQALLGELAQLCDSAPSPSAAA